MPLFMTGLTVWRATTRRTLQRVLLLTLFPTVVADYLPGER